jgi:hypothetical protein
VGGCLAARLPLWLVNLVHQQINPNVSFQINQKKERCMLQINKLQTVKCLLGILGLFGTLLIGSCAGTISVKKNQNDELNKIKKAFIVSAKNSKFIKIQFGTFIAGVGYIPPVDERAEEAAAVGKTDEIIKKELEKYNVISIIGNQGEVPQNIDVIVIYNDVWRWDFKNVLDQLEIDFINPKTNQIICEATYKIGDKEMHDFPTSEKEVPKMIKKIMESK